jgi:hypothetical protein
MEAGCLDYTLIYVQMKKKIIILWPVIKHLIPVKPIYRYCIKNMKLE